MSKMKKFFELHFKLQRKAQGETLESPVVKQLESCPDNAVCAYEYKEVLYKTQEEIDEIKEKERIAEIAAKKHNREMAIRRSMKQFLEYGYWLGEEDRYYTTRFMWRHKDYDRSYMATKAAKMLVENWDTIEAVMKDIKAKEALCES